jgi:uncharacterized protein (TIGR00369 family)
MSFVQLKHFPFIRAARSAILMCRALMSGNVDSHWKETLNKRITGLPKLLGFTLKHIKPGSCTATMEIVNEKHMAPNGFLHAGSVVAFADTTAGFGAYASLPEGVHNFTTIELKSNFLGTAREHGSLLRCEAELIHKGKSTQVWDAKVFREDNNQCIALFRCTQMHLYPKDHKTHSTN